jgi:hypothetical protein
MTMKQLDLFANNQLAQKSQLLESSGSYYLEVYYSQGSEDYDEAINNALAYHGLENDIIRVIAIPNSCF